MRVMLILVCALILSNGEALAARSKRISATGCVGTVGKCLILRSGNGGHFLLGNISRKGMVGKVVRLKGREHPGGKYVCPTRLIMEGTITVSRWKVVRRSCS